MYFIIYIVLRLLFSLNICIGMLIFYVGILLLSLCFTYLYRKNYNLKKSLWWVPVEPGYPVLGVGLELAKTTTVVQNLQRLLIKNNNWFYGEILTKPYLFVSDHKFVEWLLSSTTLINKGEAYDYLNNWLRGGLLISNGTKWKKSRKILTPAFHFGVLEQFTDVFDECSSTLVDVLSNEVGKDNVDVHPIVMNYALDVICETSMGVKLGIQKGFHKDYLDAVAFMGFLIMKKIFDPLVSINPFYRLTPLYFKEKQCLDLIHQVSNNIIKERKCEMKDNLNMNQEDDIGRKQKLAFLDLLITYRDENGKPLSDDVIQSEVDTLMFAGHDTTGVTLGFVLYNLANHPEIQSEALNEIRTILGERNRISHRDLQMMKYLELVIKETLRLYPSVPLFSRMITEDVVYEKNMMLPKGLEILIMPYAVHRDPKLYDRPNDFIPSRFLDQDPKLFSYLPFSAGPRNCIGQKFAMLELKNALAKILLNFELVPAKPEFRPILSAEAVLKTKNGIRIRLERRSV
ncbi:hypothetical protein ABEB36_013082 [Hypothenemus hampei]|uniref:Cytochrome P450 n=1 Tax=Hypothenemus hampei TaxID=57062 RepID=A0ABD1E6S3_HYPHA